MIYFFYGTWSVASMRGLKELEELEAKYPTVEFNKIDVDDSKNNNILTEYNIEFVPTVVFLDEGFEIDRFTGYSIKGWLEKIILDEFMELDKMTDAVF